MPVLALKDCKNSTWGMTHQAKTSAKTPAQHFRFLKGVQFVSLAVVDLDRASPQPSDDGHERACRIRCRVQLEHQQRLLVRLPQQLRRALGFPVPVEACHAERLQARLDAGNLSAVSRTAQGTWADLLYAD